ncbi:MAG: methylated-DNA--[protein]-cysteine S-methyltransferase [Chloroflexi bacterium]|nr:methylated-DNA--[protein]-cysteine S-methyltransferase [Chloroflexota bacterium]
MTLDTPRATDTLARDLRSLGNVRAPAGFAQAVLDEVGLGDRYFTVDSPLGAAYVAYRQSGIVALTPAGDDGAFEAAYRTRTGRAVRRAASPPSALQRAVIRTLAGERRPLRFDLTDLSPFQRAVLEKTAEIPRGEVRPYGWVAREIGRPGAVRAVGTALGRNPIPLLIPCHRVVRTGGDPGQYAFGAEAKREILAAERVDLAELARIAAAGIQFYGSDTTHIFCFPTCRHGPRITPAHRVAFPSAAAARAAGYRPCKVCRPALP